MFRTIKKVSNLASPASRQIASTSLFSLYSRNNPNIAYRALLTPPSATLAISSLARKMAQDGHDIFDLGIGEPDMKPSASIRHAAADASYTNNKIYSDLRGLPSTLRAMATLLKRLYGVQYNPATHIMCFEGGKPALDCVIETLVNPTDQVLIPTPGWLSYIPQVRLADGHAVCIPTSIETRFKILPEQLSQAITAKTKAFVFCPLNNPTGIAYTEAEIRALGDVLKKHPHVFIISDDLYWSLLFNDPQAGFKPVATFASVCPELVDRIINVTGTTKSDSWRFAAVSTTHERIINYMCNIHSHRAGHPNAIAQAGARKAIELGPDKRRSEIFKRRHDSLYPLLCEIPMWQTIKSDGGFYFFIRVQDHMRELGITDDGEYAKLILERTGVALVPGAAFGSPGHLRLSYCQDEARLMIAVGRLQKFVANPEQLHSQSAVSLSFCSR